MIQIMTMRKVESLQNFKFKSNGSADGPSEFTFTPYTTSRTEQCVGNRTTTARSKLVEGGSW